MWRGTDLNDGNPMWEPTLEFVLGGSGNTFTMAGYYGLQGSRYNDEIDYIWKYEYQLNPHFCLAFNIAYYDILHQITESYGEAYFTLTWADGPLKPAVSYYKELRPQGTDYYNFTLEQDLKCGNVPLSLGLSAGFSYGPLVPTIPGFTDLELNMSTDFVSKDYFSLSGKVAYNLTPSDPQYPTNGIVWYSLGAQFRF